MQNKIDFIIHRLFKPNYQQINFENAIPKESEKETTT